MERLKLAQIVALAPEVGAILRSARGEAHRRESIDDMYVWHKGLLARWVGWYSPVEELRDQTTYETVIMALREALDY